MPRFARSIHACLVTLLLSGALWAEPVIVADLSAPGSANGWQFFTDKVMGGVSDGSVTVSDGAIHLRGTVSTANNGGFIQARRDGIALPPEATRLVARVKGDGQVYFLHLRTRGTVLPWQYYQAPFVAGRGWSEVALPLSVFVPSGGLLRTVPRAEDVRSVALVAYGRDHEADVSLSQIRAE